MIDMSETWALATLLLCCSSFFSSAETAVMAVNRYRMQYLARVKHDLRAQRLQRLLVAPERLLGMILIGNNFMNNLLTSLMTWMVIRTFGEEWVVVATMVLTLVIMTFAEIIPKTIAAHHADSIAYGIAATLELMLWLMYPVVWVTDRFTRMVLWCVGVKMSAAGLEQMSHDELRGLIKAKRLEVPIGDEGEFQNMLVGVLDLASLTVNDVMLPRQEIEGIDLDTSWEEIHTQLLNLKAKAVLVYSKQIDRVKGVLNLADAMQMIGKDVGKEELTKLVKPVKFCPEGTLLSKQLRNFRADNSLMAAVVDEYGEICGLVNIEDIVEEIIGQFAEHNKITIGGITPKSDGSYWLSGQLGVRDINRLLGWDLPEKGANTLGGLVLDHTECFPDGPIGVLINQYRFEVLQLEDNSIRLVKIWPPSKLPQTE